MKTDGNLVLLGKLRILSSNQRVTVMNVFADQGRSPGKKQGRIEGLSAKVVVILVF